MENKKSFVNIFLNAALAYEFGTDWRSIFRQGANITIGSAQKMCKKWMNESDENFNKAIHNFMEN